MTKEVKKLLKAKQYAFRTGDRISLKIAQAELKACVRKCKEDYKNKTQAQFKQNNTKQAWHSVKSIKETLLCHSTEFANDLNTFYCRFDCNDFEVERNCAVQCANLLPEHTFEISRDDVASVFKNVKVNKAAGLEKITGKLIKQLCSVFHVLFQLCVELQFSTQVENCRDCANT